MMDGPLLERMKSFLDFSVQQQNVITSNLANMETPGYRTKRLVFEEVFRAQQEQQPRLQTSDPRHQTEKPVLLRDQARLVETGALGNDGNDVDMDRELSHLAQNLLKFSTIAQLMQKQIHLLQYSIREGRV